MRVTLNKFALVSVLLLCGCQIPQWRIFQKKVPPPITKTWQQNETDQQAAKIIAENLKEPEDLKPVAQNLSESLGTPIKAVTYTAENVGNLSKKQHESLLATRTAIQKQNEFLEKYSGQTINGTGIDMFRPVSWLSVVGLVALFILCPTAFTWFIFALRRSGMALKTVVAGVESFGRENPTMASTLKGKIADEMHAATNPLRGIVRRLKTGL